MMASTISTHFSIQQTRLHIQFTPSYTYIFTMKTATLIPVLFAAVGFASPTPQQAAACTGSDKINVLVSTAYNFMGPQSNPEICRNECCMVIYMFMLELL